MVVWPDLFHNQNAQNFLKMRWLDFGSRLSNKTQFSKWITVLWLDFVYFVLIVYNVLACPIPEIVISWWGFNRKSMIFGARQPQPQNCNFLVKNKWEIYDFWSRLAPALKSWLLNKGFTINHRILEQAS